MTTLTTPARDRPAAVRPYGGAVSGGDATAPGPVAPRPAEGSGPDAVPDAAPGLAASFVRGEDGSLARLYREHASLVFGIATRAVGPAEAEDVTQAVFVSAWRGRSTFDPSRGTLAGWLVGITRHRVADALSAARRRGEVLVDEVETLAGGEHAGDDGGEHDQAVSDRVTVLGALDDLGEPRRTLVTLAFFEEMTHREISETTGLPLGTVKSHLRRALLHLRGLLEDPAAAGAPPVGVPAAGAATGPRLAARRTPSSAPGRARGTGWHEEGGRT